MKAIYAVAAVGLGLMASIASVSAQPYGSRDYGYEERGRGYGGRDYDDEDRGRGYGGRGYGRRDYGFDEREYLRCNPDVLRAVRRGQMESGAAHYQTFGRRERRRLSC
ncbi:UNVERIFIED_ORG: hypothetical protein J2W74_001679 [Methylorubrum zatmanii]